MNSIAWDSSPYPPTLIEAICLHGYYLGLGYSRDDIFLELHEESVIVNLKAMGKQVPVRIGAAEFSADEMNKHWNALVKEWNKGGSMTDEDAICLWNSSLAKQNLPLIVAALLQMGLTRGLRPPNPKWN
jgi:hypothetical protein